MSNERSESMTSTLSTTRLTLRSCGNVTCQKRCQAVAPSTRAASMTAGSMPLSPAMKSTIT